MGCNISTTSTTNDFASQLRKQFPLTISRKKVDVFDEIVSEITRQQKILKNMDLPLIPYNKFNNISYYSKNDIDNYLNYSAIWKKKQNKIKGWKVLLKELTNSSHMTQDNLKMIATELELNDKNDSIEIFGISQNPKTLNYIIVVDFLFSGDLL